MTRTLTWADTQAARPLSATLLHWLADALRASAEALARLAVRLSTARATAAVVGQVEFHALYRDAAAPEGALYIDGKLVGVISGITRL